MLIPRILASCSKLTLTSNVPKAIQLAAATTSVTYQTIVPNRQLSLSNWCLAGSKSGSTTRDKDSTRGRSNSKRSKSKQRSSRKSSSSCSSRSGSGGDSVGKRKSNSSKSTSSFKSGGIRSGLDWAKSKMDEIGGGFNASHVNLDKANKRFTLALGNGQIAHIDYRMCGGNQIDMYHTEVPAEMRGRGIGRVLAKGALDQAAANNMKVRLTCTYLVDYLNKFADEKTKRSVEK